MTLDAESFWGPSVREMMPWVVPGVAVTPTSRLWPWQDRPDVLRLAVREALGLPVLQLPPDWQCTALPMQGPFRWASYGEGGVQDLGWVGDPLVWAEDVTRAAR